MFKTIFLAIASLITASAASAQPYRNAQFDAPGAPARPFIEGADYDPAIPTLQNVLGHAPGAEITTPRGALAYLDALAAAAPDRIRVTRYAMSWEGRPLEYAVISSPDNMARLPEIKANMAKLGDPRGRTQAEQEALIADTPAVVWLSYGVHGDEISSTDAGLALAYHLLAAKDDETVKRILANTVVVIDPSQNPDGRARFIASNAAARGLVPDADRFSAEHDQPWPGGRYNHYLFDMNRDWFAMTQPETKGRVKTLLEWLPVVLVDAHEMGADETYFFPPPATPFNPNITQAQREEQTLVGRNNAKHFDKYGFEYFTREDYDAFYPGYGDMWPTLNGVIAFTYEQASARGLVVRRANGSRLTYRDGVRRHFISTLATAESVADNKARFLESFAAYRRSAVDEGAREPGRWYVIDLQKNRWGAERLGRLLAQQGVEVREAAPGFAACGAQHPDGALLVDKAQPAMRLIRTLMDPTTKIPEDFLKEQERRRAKGMPHQFYDVTAWSLPLMFGVDAQACGQVGAASLPQLSGEAPIPGGVDAPDAAFGYAIAWSDAGQAKLVAALLREGFSGKASDKAFTVGGRTFPRGSAVFPRADNPATLPTRIAALSREIGAQAVGLDSSWVDTGPNYGSASFSYLHAPRIAMAWGEGTSPTSAGATRFVLERRYGLPVSVIRTKTLPQADLSLYDVLILPEQGKTPYARVLGERGGEAIARFADDGGVVIGLGAAMRFLADPKTDLLSIRRELAARPDAAGAGKADAGKKSGDKVEQKAQVPGTILKDAKAYDAAIEAADAPPSSLPGGLVHTVADPDHWLSAGYGADGPVALATGRDIYRPETRDHGTNVFRFAGPGALIAGGHLWAENAAQLAYKPFVVAEPHGKGWVVAFTEAPTERAFLDGLDLAVLNAVILGPAHSKALR